MNDVVEIHETETRIFLPHRINMDFKPSNYALYSYCKANLIILNHWVFQSLVRNFFLDSFKCPFLTLRAYLYLKVIVKALSSPR